jgi:DNA-binding CsgD family transcriptional regulator
MSQLATGIRTRDAPAPAPTEIDASAVLVADATGRVLAASRSACSLLGWRHVELTSLRFADLGVAALAYARICSESEAEGPAVGAVLLRHRDGRAIPVRYLVTRIGLDDGPVYHWLVRPPQPDRLAATRDPHRLRIARALRLTGRELQVVQLIADGLDNRDIARELSVTIETVKTHIRRLLVKLKALNRAHAVAIAWRNDLID